MSFYDSRMPPLMPTKPWFCFSGELLDGYEHRLAACKRSHSYSHATEHLPGSSNSSTSSFPRQAVFGESAVVKSDRFADPDDEASTTDPESSSDIHESTNQSSDLDVVSEHCIHRRHCKKRDLDSGCTMMMMNLKPTLSQADLKKSLHWFISEGLVSVMYMPMEIHRSMQHGAKNLGFAFVHLRSEKAANEFVATWRGDLGLSDRRPIEVRPARIQGAEANLKEWRRTKTQRLRNKAYRPIIFDEHLLREFESC